MCEMYYFVVHNNSSFSLRWSSALHLNTSQLKLGLNLGLEIGLQTRILELRLRFSLRPMIQFELMFQYRVMYKQSAFKNMHIEFSSTICKKYIFRFIELTLYLMKWVVYKSVTLSSLSIMIYLPIYLSWGQ